MKFSRDSEGAPSAIDDNQTILANFLQSNIQDDHIIGQEVLKTTEDILSGKINNCEFSGNAHVLILDREQAHIELAYDDEDINTSKIPLEEFCEALHGWLNFIKK